ncbi:Uma2 family endonuclease [Cohnella silvisoli]|uniref:Uma2 family endonuclease n=1 Tax=Cohnella silvisoli TaxID=2873699 RepID=A0ABV1KP89_9BACL|nr:Uma2 family endonuclease [Cohnella silvisoli]MCD9025610.1 Uma2 family endonuclease [Cohnella silvisoli]
MNPKKTGEQLLRESNVTYEMYADMPEDGKRYEVADGQLELMSPVPTPFHQLISNELQLILNSSCRNDYIIFSAPLDVIFSDREVRQPDLLMIHRSRLSIVGKRGINGAPDLVVEIMSDHSRRRDKLHKTKAYAKYGVPEYWIIDMTSSTLEQYSLHGAVYELIELYAEEEAIRSDKFPCVSFSMRQLMQEIPDLPD